MEARANCHFNGKTEMNIWSTINLHWKERFLLQININIFNVFFSIYRLYIHVEDLFNADKVLGKTTNEFLNENWSDILKELKLVFRDTIGGIVKNIVGSVFGAFPYVEYFLE